MDQYIGKMLDNRYEILEVIGTGGMAVVYKARCHRLNRLVAIKILRDDLAQDAEFRRRFHDESQAVAMLSHPNIMAVYDVSKSSDLEYIVMELLDGITLKQYMQKKGEPLSWKEALHFITQIMKALSHAHGRGIIHRDIKPQNIMVLRDGSIKVADFGIARLASAAQSTLTQEALGSVHYISPEQARGSRIDARSDIYSAGVVLYEMLTGRLPYEGDSPVSVAIQHINSIPLAPRELNPDIPEALEAITMKAMASNVEQRYLSADAMLADLEEFRKNPNINFEYTPADLFTGDAGDEPTQVIETTGRQRIYHTPPPAHSRPAGPREDEPEEDDDDFRGRRRGRSRDHGSSLAAPMAVAAILIFIVGIGVFLWMTFFSDIFNPAVQEHKVPDLRGKTLEEIAKLPEVESGVFSIVEGDTILSDEYPAGQVVKQSPEAEKTVKGNSFTITVNISAGEDSILMPGVVNKELREALAILKNEGIGWADPEYASSDTVTRNYVISTDPVEGIELAPGQKVRLVVSLGPKPETVTMIPLIGQYVEDAETMLNELGLKLGQALPVTSEEEAGRIVWQSIESNQDVEVGTTVNVQYSKGTVTEPTQPPASSTPPEESPTAPGGESSPPSGEPDVPANGSGGTEPTVSSQSIPITLPEGDPDDTLTVRIDVGGTKMYENSVPRHMSPISLSVPGSGTQRVDIYINGSLYESRTVTFS
ncbi:Stk1 family PASTA domain-containing Ser/Thr kinase [Intestinimonas massiliensis]|uniref:non-specific serine/threonine protein kinase n=1 Tax=Intestinimonas massiliensis (ex Afouda et al. 2020) TaxID=1673721 RepID=A0AAW5JSU2_9FIRM|nr:Stk1 family PASTA domain-containing Ser/Thr kinase [Intestinimonas massiliensis (ex Afouda et al. 2020)]MCQ4770954.1 Stk1 family PASTA domain-containing Ser/Thr kinase [Intestinimonas massiliensis (ex Afouda et al. 2020)]